MTFALTVVGEPPPEATFFGFIGFEPFGIRLTDPDGDGVLTGSFDRFPRGDTQPFSVVQGTGTRPSVVFGEAPGDPVTVIQDFGLVTINQDTTLPASVSFGQAAVGGDDPGSLPGTSGPDSILLFGGAGVLLLAASIGVLFLARRALVRPGRGSNHRSRLL